VNFYNMKQKIIVILLVFLASCSLTHKMWNPHYEERVEKFLLSQNGAFVVFLGEKYHYIFEDHSGFVRSLLSSKYRSMVYIKSSETYIKLSATNDLEAYVSLELNQANIDHAAELEFLNHGFVRGADGGVMSLKIKLDGKRYLASANFPHYDSSYLNREYIIKVYEIYLKKRIYYN